MMNKPGTDVSFMYQCSCGMDMIMITFAYTVKPECLNDLSQILVYFKTNHRLMQVKSIPECSSGSILQYF